VAAEYALNSSQLLISAKNGWHVAMGEENHQKWLGFTQKQMV
jgi:hypothetical protein